MKKINKGLLIIILTGAISFLVAVVAVCVCVVCGVNDNVSTFALYMLINLISFIGIFIFIHKVINRDYKKLFYTIGTILFVGAVVISYMECFIP